jgi:hypothetical protein
MSDLLKIASASLAREAAGSGKRKLADKPPIKQKLLALTATAS